MSKFTDNLKTIVKSNYRDEESYDLDDIIIYNTRIEIKNNRLKYLLFDFDREIAPGVYERVYKAIKLVKIKRVPKKDLGIASFLQMQEGVVSGFYQNQVNYIQIFANIIKPNRLGLIFAYGVQGVSSDSMEDAMKSADIQMKAVERSITGTFRTLEYIDLTAEDARWIYQKLGSMDNMRILRGVPGPKKTQGRMNGSTFNMNPNEESEEQSEEFLMGMDEFEYLYVLTATCVDPAVISHWKEQNLKEETYWASIKQGQKSISAGISMPMVFAANAGASQGWGQNTGESFGENYGTNYSHALGSNESWSEGTSHSVGVNSNHGINVGTNSGQSVGSSFGENVGTSNTVGKSDGISQSVSQGVTNSESWGKNSSVSQGTTTGESWGTSHSTSSGVSGSAGTSSSSGGSYSQNSGGSSGYNSGFSQGTSNSISGGANFMGIGGNVGTSDTSGSSSGISGSNTWGNSSGNNWSSGTSTSQGWNSGTSSGTSHSNSVSNSSTTSQGNSYSNSISNSTTSSAGTNSSVSQSQGTSYGQSTSSNLGANVGNSAGESWSSGSSESWSSNQSHSVGKSVTDSYGTSQGVSTGRNLGSSVSGGSSQGISSSMGLGPSLSFGKTMAFEDREVAHILDLLNWSTQRIITGSNGLGMWFTDIYIATDSEEAAAAATGLSISSWHDKNALTCPLQVYVPSDVEKEYLFKHMAVFSPSILREGVPGLFESYKYTTILLSSEIAAYSHPPRANVGGIQAAIDDPPILTIPGDRQSGEIFLGYVADAEKYSKERGYASTFKYTLRSDEIHHAYISGASRSGKTVAARRLVAEAYNNVRRGEKNKRLRFLIMDPKQDWRALAKIIPNDHFRFYSLSDPNFHPIKMNLLRIPRGVYTERYADKLREIFIRSYGLGDRGFQILGKAITEVYKNAGCYDSAVKYNKIDPVTGLYPASERSKNITLADVCKQLEEEINNTKQRDKMEAIQRILDRMDSFNEPLSSIYTVFCNSGDEGMGIDDLLGDDDVIVLESYGMDAKTSAFIFGLITSGVYQYAVSNDGFVKPDNQYETVLVIEEANQVLISEDSDNLGGQNPFETILDQSAGYGLFIWTLTQKISDMPRSVLANSALKLIGRQDDKDDIDRTIVQIGKDGKLTDRVFKNWLPDQPTGWFIVKSSRNRDFTKNAPTHVLIEYLDIEPPTNDELANILMFGELERQQKGLI